MKRLAATLCLTIAVLLGNAGVGYALPPYPLNQNRYYDNCYGTYTWANGDKHVGEYKNNERNGQGIATSAEGRIMEGIWKDGDLQYAKRVALQRTYNTTSIAFKQKCQEIGFTPNTEQFGNCILRLMEMQSNNRSQTVNENKVRQDQDHQLQIIREQNYKACIKTHCYGLKFGDTRYWFRKYCIR